MKRNGSVKCAFLSVTAHLEIIAVRRKKLSAIMYASLLQ